MSISISKLWSNYKFSNLSINSKLFYIHLVSHPDINPFGVLELNVDLSLLQTGFTKQQLREATKELINLDIIHVKKYDDIVYIIVPDHFNKVSTTESVIQKMTMIYDKLPKQLKDYLNSININLSRKISKFEKPTIEEIHNFCISHGYLINPEEFFEFYENTSSLVNITDYWVDGRNKIIKDWKAKLIKVWGTKCKKAKRLSDAPEGMEYYYIYSGKEFYQPDYWEKGLPKSKDFTTSKLLAKDYEQRTKNSS